VPPLPTTHPPEPLDDAPLHEGVPYHPASSITSAIGNATTPSEGVASLPPVPHTDKDAPAARPITTDEGVTSPTTSVEITDTASLEGVTNLCSSKQDSAAATERTAVDLFSGCGGLAHAARLLGFRHLALIESNERCATTLKLNGFTNVVNSLLEHSDLSRYHGADLLTAGPPCQPWSIGGRSLGEEDSRNLWAATVRAIRGIQPKAFLIEMVDGFLRPKFDTARWQLTADLQALGYNVQISKVNARDYGVPQYRRRCLIMGRRSLLPIRLPKAKPSITLREALQGLGEPDGTNRHELLGQATSYDGHEPSTLDTQAKTIRAGVHGPGGGNNTVITDNGLRYFTVREMARVQTFPDDYQFDPVWSHAIKEIGNACPPTLAKQWLESLLEGPTAETTTVPEDPPLSPGVAETAHDEAMDSLRRELSRRVKLTHILEAHVSVLQGLLDNATKTLLTQPGCIDTYILSLHERATDLESHLIPDDHDVRAAIEHSDLSSLKPEARLQVGKAVDRTLELSSLLRTLRQERALATAMAEGRTTTDTLAHLPAYENSRMTEARRAAYQHDVDSSLDATRDGHLQIPRKDLKKAVFFKCPTRLLRESPTVEDETCPLFNVNWQDTLDSGAEEDTTKYYSVRADLLIDDGTGARISLSSVVDSGAAWTALKHGFLARTAPELLKLMSPSKRRFKDAQGNPMAISGRIPLTVWMGDLKLTTYAYVFPQLSVDCLLGVNTLSKNGMIIDCNAKRLYVAGTPSNGVPIRTALCDTCDNCPSPSRMLACTECSPDDAPSHRASITYDADRSVLQVTSPDGNIELPTTRSEFSPARLRLESAITVEPGRRAILDPRIIGLDPDRLTPTLFRTSAVLTQLGLSSLEETVHNPTSVRTPFVVTNPTDRAITCPTNLILATESCAEVEGEFATLAAVLEDDTGALRGIDDGGIEDLKNLGFNLDGAIDPDLPRMPDGRYQPLHEDKKRELYVVALRYHYVWARDAKVPRVSYLVVIDIPTGTSLPQSQAAYPIPAKLRDAAMAEIGKLLKAGLIEPSMSDWASPALVRVKKDSTPDDVKIKFAIDYRRVNSVTIPDAGGLGTQSDILYGLGGRFKYLGLCDAAGGFYQFLLSDSCRHKSAFILPSAMGGTLFQWRVAPYGLTRNPAGYSRGMQFALKGLHRRKDLDGGRGEGGATSWIDDICMRATTFGAFVDLFERVLSRMAVAGMSLKGAKCELLLPEVNVLGFVATPHGLQLQKPKIEEIMSKGIPSNPKEAGTFLGAIAFLRRMIPRVSLLTAPMVDACKRHKARSSSRSRVNNGKFSPESFSEDEQEDVNQSWQATVDHLDEAAILAAPEFDDPNAEFVICTDASDYAVGGVLMQWQHQEFPGPSPPSYDGGDEPKAASKDPLDNHWRRKAGWELRIIGFYWKTLIDAQKNYAAFDKEAGAILLCIRHWAELITYHPTTVYTDSAVATSMLTKHIAPPRLQRWGMEIGTFLPHLKIAYRKGADNGLADLLSRFTAFHKYIKVRDDTAELPDDLFEYIGDAPLFVRSPTVTGKRYLSGATYKLYEPRRRADDPDGFWSSSGAPEIPGRGMRDRVSAAAGKEDEMFSLESHTHATCALSRNPDRLQQMALQVGRLVDDLRHDSCPSLTRWLRYIDIFHRVTGRPPSVMLVADGDEFTTRDASCLLAISTQAATELGCVVHPEDAHDTADILISIGSPSRALGRAEATVRLRPTLTLEELHFDPTESTPIDTAIGTVVAECDFMIDSSPFAPLCGAHAPPLELQSIIAQAVARILRDCGVPTSPSNDSVTSAVLTNWTNYGEPLPPTSPLLTVREETGEVPADSFAWQDRPDREPLDRRAPTTDPTLADQLSDIDCRAVIDALRGSARISHHERVRACDKYELLEDALYRRTFKDGEPSRAIVVPLKLRPAILSRHHFSMADGGGHVGGETMFRQLRAHYWWAGMERECHSFAAACEKCGSTRSQATMSVPIGSAPTPTRPFEVIHLDHKGELPECDGYKYVLATVCALTKFTLYNPVKSTTASETLDALITHVFSIFGPPLVIVADNGSAFANKLMDASEQLYGYRMIHVMPHTPQANGLAEAAVKKLKVALDRHTSDYQGWKPLLPAIQHCVNQRLSRDTQVPFVSLFGYPPPTLAALEQPYLLPTASPEERTIQEFGLRMRRMHLRLTRELDDLKDAETRLVPSSKPLRTVLPGDKVWLKYSDSEKSRYIRKHGKGLAWRHAFTVLATKPHAVLLEVPSDGSVPDVLPWQSLRKCSFAAPFFHDPELVLPDVDEHALPMTPESDTLASPINTPTIADKLPALPIDDAPDEWHAWREDKLYDIESIISAEPSGRGWKLRVKWEGHPTITTERLSSIVSRVTDRRILEEIDLRKAEYQGQYATVPPPPETATVAATTPTRVQPARSSRTHPVFLLSTDDSRADATLFEFACSILHVESGKRTQSLHQLEDVL
jgi:DNA (cytosine-5)-methyltransferase 1